jgi:hypothetical protein
MTDFIDSVMGFNPADLSVFKEEAKVDYNQNIYKTNPKDSKSEDGNYRSRIRVIYNPNDIKQSIVKQVTYAMKDQDGFFMVKSKLGNDDKECPLFKSWKKLRYAKKPSQTDPSKLVEDVEKKDWANQMYEKTESQWCLVQIQEDANRPELVGQIKAMKLPKAILTKMTALMNPAPETKKTPVPVMDYIFGRVLEMDVAPGPDDPTQPSRKQREISYDLCAFEADPTPVIKVDGTPFFTDDELELIDLYNTAKNDLLKAKTEKKKADAQAILTENTDKVRELYGKVVAYLKENTIDLVKECTYQPWDEATEKRVQNWIDVVATMRDPETASVEETPTETQATPAPAAPTSASDVDFLAKDFGGDFGDLPL